MSSRYATQTTGIENATHTIVIEYATYTTGTENATHTTGIIVQPFVHSIICLFTPSCMHACMHAFIEHVSSPGVGGGGSRSRPGGALRHFWEPEYMQSTPHSSAKKGTPPRLHTVSTSSSVPCWWHSSPRPAKLWCTPVLLSPCNSRTRINKRCTHDVIKLVVSS